MIHEESDKFASRLTAMANARVLFNTIAELEEFLGNRAIKSNGIKRCFPSEAKLIEAYRDCKVEVQLQTNDLFDLDWLMRHYERAWLFYKDNFARRKDPESIAKKLLECYYAPPGNVPTGEKLHAQAMAMQCEKVNIAILTLLLLKAMPGYDSKLGDVADIDAQFQKVLDFLQAFTQGCGVFDVLPMIKLALEEKHRTRLMLIYHTIVILDTYENYLNPFNIAETSNLIKEKYADLDLEGIWIEDKKCFWKMEETLNSGVYFATKYCREDGHLLTFTRFTLQIVKAEDKRLTAYFLHPVAMKHRLCGRLYGDEDHAWYIGAYPSDRMPAEVSIVRTMHSDHWPYSINLHRIVDKEQIEKYEFEIQTYQKIDLYPNCHYSFSPSIYAITQEAVYVVDEREECFYKLPRFTEHEFERLTLDDNVGILEMGPEGAQQRYLAIDERLLYIPISPRHLQRYGIDLTYEIT